MHAMLKLFLFSDFILSFKNMHLYFFKFNFMLVDPFKCYVYNVYICVKLNCTTLKS